MKKGTSWNKFAGWYDALLEEGGSSYQASVIQPNLLRVMDIRRGDRILDVGCGQGFFSRIFHAAGARVTGVDLSAKLIAIARENSPREITFHRGNAERLPMVDSHSVDKAVAVLSVQNMADVGRVFAEVSRTLTIGGRFFVVLNHPAFRVPKRSSWGWDETAKTQYRRVDGYLSESKEKIFMHPGKGKEDYTYSFHRPLQSYAKAFRRTGFAILGIEEWNSNRKSQSGPRAKAEDIARKEIPLFLLIEAIRLK